MSDPDKGMHWFYPIFDSADWLERLVPLGIKFVQLRIKDKPLSEVRAQIKSAKDICAAHNCTLVINDYWQLAIEEQCDWLHLGQEDLAQADLHAISQAGLKLGISTHDEAELDIALAAQPDYVALGPIYPTILKKMKWKQQGLERVSQWKEKLGKEKLGKEKLGDLPLVGIGGLNVDRAPGVLDAGADIVSVVTDITLNTDPQTRLKQWLEIQS